MNSQTIKLSLLKAKKQALILGAVLFAGLSSVSFASDGALESLLPADVIGFVKIKDPGKAAESFLSSDLLKKIQSSDFYQAMLQDENFAKGLKEIEKFEKDSGFKATELVNEVLGDGAIVGVRLSFPPEVLGAVRAKSKEDMAKGVKKIKDTIAQRAGAFPETEKVDYKGRTLERINKQFIFCVDGNTFFASNTPRAVRDMIDLSIDKKKKNLETSDSFKEVFSGDGKKGEPFITAGVMPRYIPGFIDQIPREVDNFLASLLASGWLETLKHSDRFSVKLRYGSKGVSLVADTKPADASEALKHQSVFFPSEKGNLESQELKRLLDKGIAGVIHLRRDMKKWWDIKDQFLNPKGQRSIVEFNNVMNLLFGGKSFQDEVLPKFKEGITLLARRVEFSELGKAPSPALPGFAAIFRIEDASKFRRNLQAGFQSIIGFINVNQAQEGKDSTFLVETERVGKVKMFTAVNDLDDIESKNNLGIEYNFSPSFAIVGNRVIIGSNREFTLFLINELKAVTESKTAVAKATGAVDRLVVQAEQVADLLKINESTLATQMVLNDGIDREEAVTRLKVIDQLIRLFKSVRLSTRISEGQAQARLLIQLAEPKTPVKESL